jgi:tRNA(fMet)-specific endonuclease VapC
MIFLLDTDTFILLLRGSALRSPRTAREQEVADSAKRIRERVCKEAGDGRQIGLSAISLAELEYGLHAGGRYTEKSPAMQRVLLPFEKFSFEPVHCIHHYGRIRAALEQAGTTIGPLDLLIAAHALALNATLVSHNTREFGRVPDLSLEDWA